MVLFVSDRPLGRCENITAIYTAYQGEKQFAKMDGSRSCESVRNADYKLLVADEFVRESKAPVIMIMHGAAGIKRYGTEQPFPYLKPNQSDLLKWVICSSEATVDLMAKQSGVPREKVLPLGMPRMDNFKPAQGEYYLYCPTFRNRHESQAPKIDWELINSLLTDGEYLWVKNHMTTGLGEIGNYEHIGQLSPSIPTTPWLEKCKCLITDYSSIMVDAHVMGKPVVLFEKDFDVYQRERGMCRPYPAGYAARHTSDERQLVELIRSADCQLGADLKCKNELGGACDGHATERLLKLIEQEVGW